MEGKSVVASWNRPPPAGLPEDLSGLSERIVELESGFGTPLLIPRARVGSPVLTGKEDARKEHHVNVEKHTGSGPKKASRSASVKRAEARNSGSPRAANRRHPGGGNSKARRGTRIRRTNDKKRKASKSRDVDSDEEHHSRLAQRRERRREKKAIVNPMPMRATQNLSDEDAEDRRSNIAKKTSKESKKSRGPRMPAGLALMHGFSATNVGRNRLTVRSITSITVATLTRAQMGLRQAVGVFNKGKASNKTAVKKTRPASQCVQHVHSSLSLLTHKEDPLTVVQLFSEEHFLSKPEQEVARDTSEEESSIDGDSGLPATNARLTMDDPKGRAHSTKSDNVRRKRTRRLSKPSSSNYGESGSNETQEPRSPVRKRHKDVREASPIWDIELEGGKLPSDSGSEMIGRSGDGKTDGTVVLDTRAGMARWAAAISDHQPAQNGEERPRSVDSFNEDAAETSSIAPSESASRADIPRMATFPKARSPTATVSKYFPLSSRTLPATHPSVLRGAAPSVSVLPMHELGRSAGRSQTGASGGLAVLEAHSRCELTLSVSEQHAPANLVPALLPDAQPTVLDISQDCLTERASYSPSAKESPLGCLSGPLSPAISPPQSPEGAARLSSVSHALASLHGGGCNLPLESLRRSRRRGKDGSDCPRASPYGLDLATANGDLTDLSVSVHEELSMNLGYGGVDIAHQAGDDSPSVLFLGSFAHLEFLDAVALEAGYADGTSLGCRAEYPANSQDYADASTTTWYPAHQLETDAGELVGRCSYSPHTSDYGEEGGQELRCATHPSTGVHGRILDVHPQVSLHGLGEVDFEELLPVPDDAGDSAGPACELAFDPELESAPSTARCGGAAATMELPEDLGSESDQACSVLGSLHRFSQGRALLMGVSDVGSLAGGTGLLRAEQDVMKSLKGHWQPQRQSVFMNYWRALTFAWHDCGATGAHHERQENLAAPALDVLSVQKSAASL
ncbi:hypothetical protein BD414DRAFT_504985 [Trametes punicea]|nr:hypothetical protein BD414DRAFT_504985 [Trametes punicea]